MPDDARAAQLALSTRLVHPPRAAAGDAAERTHAVSPIHRATVWPIGADEVGDDIGTEYEGLRYPRYQNTTDQLDVGAHIADLEGAEAGLLAASGMAAISAALLSVADAGDHVLAAGGLYGGTHKLISQVLPRYGVDFDIFDARDVSGWDGLVRPTTKAIYVETMGNPLVTVPDHEAVVALARRYGLVAIIDNTFATPVTFRPLAHGFDLVVHSATKALNGHSDVLVGALAGSRTRIDACDGVLRVFGGSIDPQAAYLLRRGLGTLELRVRRKNANALALARWLESRDEVASVLYPGLPTHPDHARAKSLFLGADDERYGSMVAFDLAGGWPAAHRFLDAVRLAYHAPSLGGLETLVVSPAKSSHALLPADERRALGIGDGLIRLSVGIEDVGDLRADLGQALDRSRG